MFFSFSSHTWSSISGALTIISTFQVAMELLDCTYPDPKVRAFAVKCLEDNLDNNRLDLYLLQLVQVSNHDKWALVLERACPGAYLLGPYYNNNNNNKVYLLNA